MQNNVIVDLASTHAAIHLHGVHADSQCKQCKECLTGKMIEDSINTGEKMFFKKLKKTITSWIPRVKQAKERLEIMEVGSGEK